MALASPQAQGDGIPRVRSSGSISGSEIVVEEFPAVEKVYVAVRSEVKEGKSTLLWALQNVAKEQTVVVAHVHRPAQMIPLMGGKFPASQLEEKEVKSYRKMEREKIDKRLEEYLTICSELKVRAEKLVVIMEDVGKGLVQLITRLGITKLIMGAAADKLYSKKMNAPKSKTAINVKQQADPSCNIWFVCKGRLIYTREACLDASGLAVSPMASPSFISTQSDQLRLGFLFKGQSEQLNWHSNHMKGLSKQRSKSEVFDFYGGIMAALPPAGPVKLSPQDKLIAGRTLIDSWEAILRRTYPSPAYSSCSDVLSFPGHSSCLASDYVLSYLDSPSVTKYEEREAESANLPSTQNSDDDLLFSTPDSELEDMGIDAEVYHKLQQALTEAESLKNEAYQESCRRQKAERDAIKAILKAEAADNLYTKEARQRKEAEESLERGRMEIDMLRSQRDDILEQLQKANDQKLVLEIHIADSDKIIKDLEDKLSEAQYLLDALREEHEELQQERDNAVREAEELQHKKDQVISHIHEAINFSEFSYLELEQATRGFCNSLKIGEGSYGSVYKGVLRNTTVAIKTLNPESRQGQLEFHQEVDVLSRVRHPNLITLIGACSEAWAVIYEFFPHGSLEDRLSCKNNTPPLTWQVRTRIAAEICSALIFLHSHRPHPVVHGDLKPDNILLDANFVSKLSDFGIRRLLIQSNTTTLFRHTHPKGTFVYMDPEYLTMGELTPYSDIYSFGIVILRLLTGRPAYGIVKEVQEAVDKGRLEGVLDVSAGDWPFMRAMQLAHLGLRCCQIKRKNRPDLEKEVWPVLEIMRKAASLSVSPFSFGSIADDRNPVPNYFICPILQEIMKDPHIAADGFTYEAESLKGWFDSGHDTSPMTNLKLPHCNLVPNRALRSAIQEWIQLQKQQL